MSAALTNLAVVHNAQNDFKKSAEVNRSSIEIHRRLVNEAPIDSTIANQLSERLATGLLNLGEVLVASGKPQEAIKQYEEAATIFEELIQKAPIADYRKGLAVAFSQLAAANLGLGNAVNAKAFFEKAIDGLKVVVDETPDSVEYASILAKTYSNCGLLNQAMADLDAAIENHGNSIATMSRLVDENPSVTEYQESLAKAYSNQGIAYQLKGNLNEAIKRYELATQSTTSPALLASSYNNLANAQYANGNVEESARLIAKVIETTEPLANDNPQVATYRHSLGIAHFNLSSLYHGMDDKIFDAIVHAEKSTEYWKGVAVEMPMASYQTGLAQAFDNLGKIYYSAARYDDSILAFENAIEVWNGINKTTEVQFGWADTLISLAQSRSALSESSGALADLHTARQVLDSIAQTEANSTKTTTAANRINKLELTIRHKLAWRFATHSSPNERDGEQAVAHAKRACELTEYSDYGHLDTLSAAYAEAGDFEQAVEYQEKAIEIAPDEFHEELDERLTLYREGKPYRAAED